MTNHQREGSQSNSHVGKAFELLAKAFFEKKGMALEENFPLEIGLSGTTKKPHRFDLGDRDTKVIVECKTLTWTQGGNVPSAKMTTLNQAMYFFLLAPKSYRKILFLSKRMNPRGDTSLAQYYARINRHLIPGNVEIWELDEATGRGYRVAVR